MIGNHPKCPTKFLTLVQRSFEINASPAALLPQAVFLLYVISEVAQGVLRLRPAIRALKSAAVLTL